MLEYDDGDQVTIKLIWTLEANKECAEVMNSKSFFVSPNGENVRAIKYEVYQTFYDMTREPYTTSRHLGNDVKKMLLERSPKDYTFDFLRSLFGDTSIKKDGKIIIRKSPYEKQMNIITSLLVILPLVEFVGIRS